MADDEKKVSRFTVDVPLEVRRRMRHADDGIPDSTRARLLLELWAEDPELQRQVGERHEQLQRERYRLRHKT